MWYNLFLMIKTALFVLTFLISSSPAFAESRATVKVNNNVSGSSTANMESYTNITVETDGNTTRYTTNESGSVEVNSVNGVTEIKKDGSVVTGNESNNPTSEPTASPTAKPSQKPDQNNNNQNRNIFEVFEDLFKKVFSFFG